ncbi:hypothetical protein ELS19_17215 [Halogeometricum borinquense]|uniref:Uncharacterized protein n=1 Tax=Halogeometricum borinquense TaxID=60847 RepID=A0A482T6T6_9EURY|nr:hypothetical protein [Halogeometricum borinquense]RYJ08295.1 hypothetical protein ELS19_17215 [Halogeometricum borinquense]
MSNASVVEGEVAQIIAPDDVSDYAMTVALRRRLNQTDETLVVVRTRDRTFVERFLCYLTAPFPRLSLTDREEWAPTVLLNEERAADLSVGDRITAEVDPVEDIVEVFEEVSG